MWTTARTWVTGETPTAAIMNAHVRDNLNYLYSTTGEVAYAEFTAPVSVATTSETPGATIVTAGAVTFDGATRIIVEFMAPIVSTPATAAFATAFTLFDGSTNIGRIGEVRTPAAAAMEAAVYLATTLTPSNASHTYSIRAFNSAAGTTTVTAGSGGGGAWRPGFIRITRAA